MKKSVLSILNSLEKTGSEYWNISPQTGQFLNLLIKEKRPRKVLEIGTSNGYSGIWIAEALSHYKGHLYTIESHFKERFHLATQNFQQAGLTSFITQILGHAPEAIPKTPKKFDLLFLDATKQEHVDYLKALLPRLNKNGIIISDNINSHREAMEPYFQAVRKNKNLQNIALNIGSGLLISILSKTP